MTASELECYLIELQSTNPLLLRLKELSRTYNIYICGGYLRNVLLNNCCNKDLDIFVDCGKEEFKCLVDTMSKWGDMQYGQYGSPRLYCTDPKIDYIDIVPFYNFIVAGKPLLTIDEILRNFDFTLNAIAWSLRDGTLLDPLNGIADASNKKLRAVRLDFPEMMVSKDIQISAVSVFWFRLLHYQNVLGLTFDPITESWIIENYCRIKDYDQFCKYFFKPSISDSIIKKLR